MDVRWCINILLCCLQFNLVMGDGDTFCDGCNDRLSRQLEKTNKDLSRCRANHLAIETRESVFKENAASCEEKRKSVEQMSARLAGKLEEALQKQTKDHDNFQIERDALLQTVASLKKAQNDLQQKYDTAILEHRSATETQQIRHAQQLELVMSHNTQLDSELLEAANAQTALQEINTQLKAEIKVLEAQKTAALDDADQLKSKFATDQSSCEVSLSSLQKKLDESNKLHALQLHELQSACESQMATVNDQMTKREEELQSTIAQLRQSHSQETRSLKESCEGKLSEHETSCSSKITELDDQHQQLEASMQSKLVELEADCNKHSEELEKTLREEIDRTLIQGIEIGKNKTSTGIRRLKLLNSKLQESQRSLMDQTDSDAARLRQVKEELFEVRRELFLANEKLREPTIRHRTRMKRVRTAIDAIITLISPFHHAYVMPLWVPVYRHIMKAIHYFEREHLPGILSSATIVMASTRDAMSLCYNEILHAFARIKSINSESILIATERERRFASDCFLNIRRSVLDETLFPFYQVTLKPAIDTHWLPLYEIHIFPAWKTFSLALSPYLATLGEHWKLGVHYHNSVQERVAKSLHGLADVASDYGHVQNYIAFAQLCETIRDRSTDIIYIVESFFVGVAILITLIFFLRCQRPLKKIE